MKIDTDKMKINYQSAVMFVKDIEAAKKFYIEVLDQEIENDFGKCIGFKSKLSLWEVPQEHIIPAILGKNYNMPEAVRSELCFETEDDITGFDKRIKEHNVQLFHQLQEEPWGQFTIRFYDPDGHLIEMGESIPCFIKRMYANNMTIEQIVAKTGVPDEKVKEIIH